MSNFYRPDNWVIIKMDDGWTVQPVEVTGEDIEDVKKSLLLMLHDIDKHGVKDYA